eukprot:scaffold110033_cov30-Phaeocystis_antarctica.AAC.1
MAPQTKARARLAEHGFPIQDLRFSNESWLGPDSRFRIYDFRTKVGSGRIADSGSTIFERKFARAGLRIQDLRFSSPPWRSNEPPTYPG